MNSELGPGSLVRNGEIKLLSRLGLGGFGEVFLAQTQSGLRAVKVVNTALWSESEYEVFNAMHMSEASFLSTLDHPALPKFADFFAEKSRYFLVMDWVKGQNLEEFVQNEGPLELDDLFGLLGVLTEFLAYLHRRCEGVVVFGDLKPANILRVQSGEYKLVDLGLVTKKGAKLSTKIAVFSPNYSAPERARCKASDPIQDIYSFGATTFFALTGEEPRREYRASELQERIRRGLKRMDCDWGDASMHCLQKLLTLVLAAMDPDPDRRPDKVRTFEIAWQRTKEVRDKELAAQPSQNTDDIVKLLYRDK